MSPWFPFPDRTAVTPVLHLCSLCQGYGDHKPKSSTAAQEVKTLDGIFTEQVSGGLQAGEKRRAPAAGRSEAMPHEASLGLLLGLCAWLRLVSSP